MMFTKATTTTSITLFVILSSFYFEKYSNLFLSVGLFSFSGSITNWLAVHMLFERVPFLYGSGVIPNRFEQFKDELKKVIIIQFFNKKRIKELLGNGDLIQNLTDLDKLDYNNIFDELIDAITSSKLGSMLEMIGGAKALEPLRDPVIEKLKAVVIKLSSSYTDNKNSSKVIESLIKNIEELIDNRLDELSPEDIKVIVQKMIKEHLGWLVVWGGVFGGFIGLLVELSGA